jgi:hypothetical protein
MDNKTMIELFAGSAEIAEQFKKAGYKTTAVDWKQYGKIDQVVDVKNLTHEDIKDAKYLHASFDCKTYTIAACSKHRHKGTLSPKTQYAIDCDAVNVHVLHLIYQRVMKDPDFKFTIENPRGNLRKMLFMIAFENNSVIQCKRHTVWYCKYGDERAKPTDVWTNIQNWTPRPMCKNYKYDENKNVIARHCHHEPAQRGAKTGTQGRKGSYERSKDGNSGKERQLRAEQNSKTINSRMD